MKKIIMSSAYLEGSQGVKTGPEFGAFKRNSDGSMYLVYNGIPTKVSILQKGDVQEAVVADSDNEGHTYRYYPVQIQIWWKIYDGKIKDRVFDFRVFKDEYGKAVMTAYTVEWKKANPKFGENGY